MYFSNSESNIYNNEFLNSSAFDYDYGLNSNDDLWFTTCTPFAQSELVCDKLNNLCDALNEENSIAQDSIYAEEGSDIDSDEDEVEKPELIALKNEVKNEINTFGIEETLDFCLRSKECKDEKKNISKIRYKQTKSNFQLKKLQEALEMYPLKFPKKKRIELGKEIGLSETQIYKWYYDNNPNVAKKRKATDSDSTSDDEYASSSKRRRIE